MPKRRKKRNKYTTLFSIIGIFFLTGCIAAALDYNHTKQFSERKILPREEMRKVEGNLVSYEEIYLRGTKNTPDRHFFEITLENGETYRICENTLSVFNQSAFVRLKPGSKVELLLDESKRVESIKGFEIAEVCSDQKYYLMYEDYVKIESDTQKYYWKTRWFSALVFFMLGGGFMIGITLICWYKMEKERKLKENKNAFWEERRWEKH